MPRRSYSRIAPCIVHVFNRAIQDLCLFETSVDYELFLRLMALAVRRFSMVLLAYVVMPNHWHLVLWPQTDDSLPAFMHWLTGTHARRWRRLHGTRGRGAVYQGRYKVVPVQRDISLLRLCGYVERNPTRAGLVRRAEDWDWSSASPWAWEHRRPPLAPWPIPKPPDWLDILNAPQPADEVDAIRAALRTGRPIGKRLWCALVEGRSRQKLRHPRIHVPPISLRPETRVPVASPDLG